MSTSNSASEEGQLPSNNSCDLYGNGYDPTHPDADWSGFIKPRESRKHPTSTPRAMKVQLVTDEHVGFVPHPEADTNEWSANSGRKIVCDCKDTSSLIGGPKMEPDSQWESEAQAANARKRTSIDKWTECGRAMKIRTRKEAIPPFELTEKYNKESHRKVRNENPYNTHTLVADDHAGFYNDGKDVNNLVGYRAYNNHNSSNRSFLSGIAKDIVGKVEVKHHVAPAPYATDGNLPTDPYLTTNGERKKDLLLENFSSVTPGYTGKRTFL